MKTLVDTGFLIALVNQRDNNHQTAALSKEVVASIFVVPEPVLVEVFYMISDRLGYAQAVKLFDELRGTGYQIETLIPVDFTRMSEIMHQYMDAHFDYVDVSIMALSERLNITRVCTFDRRDFPIFRPKHCDALELLP